MLDGRIGQRETARGKRRCVHVSVPFRAYNHLLTVCPSAGSAYGTVWLQVDCGGMGETGCDRG